MAKWSTGLPRGMSAPDPLRVAVSVPLGTTSARIYRVERLAGVDPVRWARRPRTVRVILENVVRHFDPARADLAPIVALANGEKVADTAEFQYFPERILLQDFTGVPVIVDLATLRSAAVARGLPPEQVNPLVPVHLIVDHSVQVDSYGSPRSLLINLDKEYERNHERYRFLQWAKTAYSNYHIVPPGNGICHQVNLEYLSQVVVLRGADGEAVAFPDTLLGTDSHTTMVNGLSVLGWGVGGIEAEAVMLGEPYTLPRPVVVGVELTGTLAPGATATDLVLTVTRRLRETGVVDQFVEFFGPGRRPTLRPGPGDDLQHVSGVRRDRRPVPDRRGDDRLPPRQRTRAGPSRAGRSVRPGDRPLGFPRPGLDRLRPVGPSRYRQRGPHDSRTP